MTHADAAAREGVADDDLVHRKILATLAPFNHANIELTPQTDIAAELELDSIAVMDLVMEIEDAYDISFPINMISEIRTIGELTEAVRAMKRGETP